MEIINVTEPIQEMPEFPKELSFIKSVQYKFVDNLSIVSKLHTLSISAINPKKLLLKYTSFIVELLIAKR